MKTKLIILTAAIAALLYSCTSDRDETMPVAEKAKKPELKLNPGQMSRETTELKKDTIIITRDLLNNGPADPTDPIDPDDSEIVPPGDVKPPKGGK